MTEIVKVEPKRKVLEPTEVFSPGGKAIRSNIIYREWHPSPEMRKRGYIANPDICRHQRKGYTPRDGWWCRDCGDWLKGA